MISVDRVPGGGPDASRLEILHVVRRYGPVGGMERYVWELTGELAAQGHRVGVLCEEVCAPEVPSGVDVFPLGALWHRPRWIAHLCFSWRVRRWVGNRASEPWLIHSHERTGNHQVTTFHGPPFARIRSRPLWRRASLRVAVHLWLERREVCGPKVRAVVPNSRIIAEQLREYYPDAIPNLVDPVVPGVALSPVRSFRPVPGDGGIVGFVGYEWRRKGLEMAVRIARGLVATRPKMEFWVVGPDPGEVRRLFRDFGGTHRLLGTARTADVYPKMDLLLHPALQEPYGMVVAEAMAAKVGVVISDQCGVAETVNERYGAVLSLHDPLDHWIAACHKVLERSDPWPGYTRSWNRVAREYERLYRSLKTGAPSPGGEIREERRAEGR